MAHLYASFADASLAEKAAGALLDYGVRQEDLSLVAHDQYGQTREAYTTQAGAAPGAGYGAAGDAQYGTATSTAAGVGRGASNVGDSAVDATQSAGDRLAQVGDRMAGGVSGAFGAEGTAAGYDAAAAERAGRAEVRAGMAGHEADIHGSAAGAGVGNAGVGNAGVGNAGVGNAGVGNAGVYPTASAVGTAGDLNPLDQGGPDSAASQGDAATAAKHGISTTTPEDAGEGAVKGTGIGLGVGILASLAALTIPGVGLVLGGGALAAALGATALTAGAGAIAGGATGYLKDQGIPHEAAERYHGTVAGGGAFLSVNIPSGDVDQATAEAVLSKYGAADVNTY